MAIKIAISCCTRLFSESLKSLLENESDIEIINNSGSDLNLKEILKYNPDIILTDFNSDFVNLSSTSEEFLNENKVRILLIGDRSVRFVENNQLRDLISRGVVGILPPSADSQLLKKAIQAIYHGELWLDRSTVVKLLSCLKKQENSAILAKREKEIVYHICQGYRNKEIAQKMRISEQTVKSHCNRIYRKLGVSDRLQLALHYQRIYPDNAQRSKKSKL